MGYALWLICTNYPLLLSKRGPPEIGRSRLALVALLLNSHCWFRYINVYFMWAFIKRPEARPVEYEFGTTALSVLCGGIGVACEACFIKNRITVAELVDPFTSGVDTVVISNTPMSLRPLFRNTRRNPSEVGPMLPTSTSPRTTFCSEVV